MSQPARVLLAQMPMGLVQVPSLALSLLKPALIRAGIPCDVRYLNIEYLQQFLGGGQAVAPYIRTVEQLPLAEICAASFSTLRFGRDPGRDEIVAAILETADQEQREVVEAVHRSTRSFLDYCLEAVDWTQYALVGFTSLFPGMTIPSVVLGGLLKERFPHLRVVLGGWNTGGGMGEVLAEKFVDELDYVLRGEADETLPALAAAVLAGTEATLKLPGLIATRQHRQTPIPQQLVGNLDALPFPDFDDYFVTLAADDDGKPHARTVSFESSRGCWWGEKSHCKFCGLNGLSMPFRSKSPARVLAEMDHIVDRYHPTLVLATDTIIDTGYFADLLPRMKDRYENVRFAYEVKAPVTREQMQAMADARVSDITIGIESLATRLLRVMGKGTTSLQNIHALRVGAETGVRVGWQHLIGFPDESFEDYRGAAVMMERLHHLVPPEGACPVTVARFSPYFEQATALKVGNVRPASEYLATYPWPAVDVGRVAYHFEFDHQDGRDPALTERIATTMRIAVRKWQTKHATARLDAYRGHSVVVIVDSRRDAAAVYVLSGFAKAIYDELDTPVSQPALVRRLLEIDAAAVSDWFSRLFDMGEAADATLLEWAVEHARATNARLIRLRGDAVPTLDTDELLSATRAMLARLDDAGLIASEDDRFLALAVWRDRGLLRYADAELTPHHGVALNVPHQGEHVHEASAAST